MAMQRNYANNETINGGNEGDLLINGDYSVLAGNNVLINGNGGNDTLSSYGKSSTLNGNSGADLIFNGYSYFGFYDNETVKVEDFHPGVQGDISGLFSRGNNSTVTGGDGNDTIMNIGASVSIDGGTDNDSIISGGDAVTITGGSDNGTDFIVNGSYYTLGGNDVSIVAGGGNDTLSSHGKNSTLDGGAGNDTILNGYTYALAVNTITSETLNAFYDSIVDSLKTDFFKGEGSKVTGGSGDDLIKNLGSNASLDGGEGKDFLINGEFFYLGGNSAWLVGGIDNDTLSNGGASAILDGGAGDDLIYNGYAYSETQDYFYDHTAGSVSSQFRDGDNSSITSGAGNDSITNRGTKVSITSGDGSDMIANYGANATIGAGNDNDTILNSGNAGGASISGGGGIDSIKNLTDNVSIDGGDDDDILINGEYGGISTGSKISIAGGAGNDFISSNGLNATIDGGEGNDSIFNGYSYYESVNSETGEIERTAYKSTVEGYTGNRSSITSGAGDDLIRNSGANSIIDSGEGKDSITNDAEYVTINGGDGEDTIVNEGRAAIINGDDGNDSIYGSYLVEALVNGGAGNDTVNATAFYSTLEGGNGNDTVTISGDNVSVNGGEGNDTLKVRLENSTLEGGTDNDVIDLTSSTGNNLIVYNTGDGNDTIFNFSSSDTLSIAGGSYDSVVSDDILVVTVGEDSIKIYDAAWLSSINIVGTLASSRNTEFVRSNTSSPVTVASDVDDVISFGRTKAVQITGNAKDNLIVGGRGADTLDGEEGNDTLTGGHGSDIFVYTAGDDIITDYATGDKISLASDVTISDVTIDDNDVVLATENGSLTIVDGYKVRRYNGNLSTAEKKIAFVTGKSSTSYIFNEHKIFNRNKNSITLTAGASDSTLTDLSVGILSRLKTIDASNSALKHVTGNGKANMIYAAASGATVNGAKGNDTLYGGDGADVFVYAKNSGKDVISNYDADDVISLGAGAIISDISTKNTDVIFKVGSKKNVVKDATDTTITFSENGTIKTFSGGVLYNEDETSATVSSNLSTATTINSAIIDASAVRKAVNISGDDSANSIVGGKRNDTLSGAGGKDTLEGGKGNDKLYGNSGDDYISGGAGKDSLYGGAGNDTLIGGKGNDSLWGEDGADEFIFGKGGGSDFIFGFADEDTLTLDKVTIKKSTVSKKGDVVTLKLSSGSITFKDFTTTTFHIGKDTYSISDGNFVKK